MIRVVVVMVMVMVMVMIHPSTVTFTTLQGQKKTPLQLLSSGQCAPHSCGVESPPSLPPPSAIGATASRPDSIVVPP